MSKNAEKTYSKAKLWQKLLALPVAMGMLLLWFIDRAIHCLLPHMEHGSFRAWTLDESSFKMTLARIFVVSIFMTIIYFIYG